MNTKPTDSGQLVPTQAATHNGGMDTKPLHIFQAGTHTAMSGATLAFSEADLAAAAAAYDPALHEAPLVCGHPKHDMPAYGWVKSLQVADGGLEATPDQVDPAFAELVAAGRFKKISAAFYSPTAKNNPVPGVYYLRHVGFLGAQPPAVKGLRNPEFAADDGDIVEFADWDDMQNAGLWRRMRDWLIGRFGLDEADKVIPDYTVASLEQAARETDPEPADTLAQPTPQPLFTEPVLPDPHSTKEEPCVTPEQKAALEAENQQLKTQLAQLQANRRQAEFSECLASLVQQGKVLPAEQPGLLAFMQSVAAGEAPLEFGEGQAKVSQPALEFFKDFLSHLPKRVEFGEVAGGKADKVDLADPRAIAEAAAELCQQLAQNGQDISFAEAVSRVTAQQGA